MGDSRSWAAEREDEITICRHGNESRYIDTCECRGCKLDREISIEIRQTLDTIKSHYEKKHTGGAESVLTALKLDLEELRRSDG